MSIFYYLLAALMFLDCVLLVFLVLLQLPKKEAGAGMAFGGAATDALFGAGSGNVLTKITKYVAGAFFGIALIMAIMAAHRSNAEAGLESKITSSSGAPVAPQTAPASGSGQPSSGFLQLTNAPAAPAKVQTGTATNASPSASRSTNK